MKINYLKFYNKQKVAHYCPDHFETITVQPKYKHKNNFDMWLSEFISGRYYIGDSLYLNDLNEMKSCIKIGFEEKKDMTYFLLACPFL